MGRFNNRRTNPVSYNEDEKTENLLRKVALSPEQDDSVSSKKESSSTEDDNELKVAHGREIVGKSLLSPRNEVHQNTEKEYVSPFDEDFHSTLSEDEEELFVPEEEAIISRNRLKFLFVILGIFYVCALGIGYHYTGFSDGVPRLITPEEREKQDYLGRIDEYISTLQNAHADILLISENYAEGVIADDGLVKQLTKEREKLDKNRKEMSELVAPAQFESFQNKLDTLYSVQMAFLDNSIAYAKGKSESALQVAQDSNVQYEETMEKFLEEYDSLFLNGGSVKSDKPTQTSRFDALLEVQEPANPQKNSLIR